MVIADSEAGFPWNCSSVVDKIYKTDNYYVNVTKRKTGRVIIFFRVMGYIIRIPKKLLKR